MHFIIVRKMKPKHIVIDARIRRASTGRPIDRLLEYLQALDTKNHYTVLLEPDDPWQPKAKNFKTVSCRFSQFSFNPLNQIAFSWQLYRLKPDLVHFTMTGQQPLFYFGRQVTMTHDLIMFKFARKGRLPWWAHWLRMKGYKLLMWQAHRKAKVILVPTQYVRDAVAKFHLFTNRKIVITPEASEPPIPGQAEQPSYYTTSDFILYVGSSFPHKNLRRLVKAFELLKETHPTLKLFLVGKKEQHAKKLERWVNKLNINGVVFTGFVPDSELKWLYQNAKAYVFPSLSEGFGLPGLEAMAHGCPVVSSNATCLPEVYEDAAHYFDPENVEEMAAKIAEVIDDDKLRQKLVAKGYAQTKKFSWKRMADETLEVYEAVLDTAAARKQ